MNNVDEYYEDLMSYLPSFYKDVNEVKEIQLIFGQEMAKIKSSVKDLLDQCFISSSTYGLDFYERMYGITIDRSKSFEERREIIKAKLRGSGTATKELIKNVSTAFSGGEVEIEEHPEEYSFIVKFVGTKGIPKNMEGLISALEEIKPAHLSYSFKYTFTIWGQINKTLPWIEAKKMTWAELKVYKGE